MTSRPQIATKSLGRKQQSAVRREVAIVGCYCIFICCMANYWGHGIKRRSNLVQLQAEVKHETFRTESQTASPARTESTSDAKTKAAAAVIVLSQCRSGSSIVGQLFDRRYNVSYFYEPLYPLRTRSYVAHPVELSPLAAEVIGDLVKCRFDRLSKLYAEAFKFTRQPDKARCMKDGLCFADKTQFLRRDASICGNGGCPSPIDHERLAEVCEQSALLAMKVNYLARMRDVAPLLNASVTGAVVKVVHVVRDPRAVVASSIRPTPQRNKVRKARDVAAATCQRLTENVFYADDELTNNHTNYVRVRHEDFATDPVGTTRKIYHFIGHEIPSELLDWVERVTARNNPKSLSLGGGFLVTDAVHTATAWRQELDFGKVDLVQKQCSSVMQKLGYKLFDTETDFKDMNKFGFSSFD